MMFKTHLALGALACILAINYLKPESQLLFGGILIFAAVFPDIDISKSKVGKSFRPVSWIISFLFGHRGLMHTIFPPAIGFLACTYTGFKPLGIAFLAGYGTHLAGDIVTKQGGLCPSSHCQK